MELHRPTGRRALGISLASLTMLLWGVLPLVLDAVLRALPDPVTITWFRFGVSALAMGAWLGARRRLPPLRVLGRGGAALLLIATTGLGTNYVCYLMGLGRTSPASIQVLIQLGPLFLALGGLVVFQERFARLQWLGFAVLVCGIGFFFASQLRALAGEIGRYLAGVALIVLAALTWSFYGLAQKQLLRWLTPRQIMLCIYVGCFLALSAGAHPAGITRLTPAVFGLLLFCAANTLVAYTAFATALSHWEASRVSAVLSLTPLATLGFVTLAAAWLPGRVPPEPISAASWLGAGLVVAGSLTVSLGGARTPAAVAAPGGTALAEEPAE